MSTELINQLTAELESSTETIDKLTDELERLRAALLEQAELWDLATPTLDAADALAQRVPFIALHEPEEKAREAARVEV